MTTLSYQGLSLTAGGTPILDAVDLEIEGPGLFALLGPSGVGKSSLLRATQRLIENKRAGWQRRGDVLLDGESIFGRHLVKHELARRIGFVQQRPRMLAGSARANVTFALRHTTRLARAEIRRRAEEAIDRVGLAGELASLETAAWKLSGGQAQRLAIARAIALDPDVLLMDEPISSLDPMSAERVVEVIRDIARERLVVLVTHKVGLAVRLADAAGFMLRGEQGARLVEVGAAPAIFERPRDPVAVEFVRMGYGQLEHRPASSPQASSPGAPAEAERRARAAVVRRPQRVPVPVPVLGRLVLFICGGNTSRSPIAQAICNTEVARRLGVELSAGGAPIRAQSAGLAVEDGRAMVPDARDALAALGFSPHEHTARTVTAEDVAGADTVFCMTESQRRALVERFPRAADKVHRLDPISDIANPAGQSAEVYLRVARRIRDAVRWRLGQVGEAAGWAGA